MRSSSEPSDIVVNELSVERQLASGSVDDRTWPMRRPDRSDRALVLKLIFMEDLRGSETWTCCVGAAAGGVEELAGGMLLTASRNSRNLFSFSFVGLEGSSSSLPEALDSGGEMTAPVGIAL